MRRLWVGLMILASLRVQWCMIRVIGFSPHGSCLPETRILVARFLGPKKFVFRYLLRLHVSSAMFSELCVVIRPMALSLGLKTQEFPNRRRPGTSIPIHPHV